MDHTTADCSKATLLTFGMADATLADITPERLAEHEGAYRAEFTKRSRSRLIWRTGRRHSMKPGESWGMPRTWPASCGATQGGRRRRAIDHMRSASFRDGGEVPVMNPLRGQKLLPFLADPPAAVTASSDHARCATGNAVRASGLFWCRDCEAGFDGSSGRVGGTSP